MKKLLLIAGLMAVCGCAALTSGCAGCANDLKHIKSDLVGLSRHITLYGNNGVVIREWDTRAKVEDKGGTCWFIVDGKAVTISGTFIIEEK